MITQETAENQVSKLRQIAGNNRRAGYVVVLLLIGLWWTGRLPSLPSYWPVVVVPLVAGGAGAYYYSDRVLDLLPDKEGIILVEFDASDDSGGRIHEVSEQRFDDMEIEDGSLYQWDTSRRVYEVRGYDPQSNTAKANWRESEPGSTLADEPTVEDALAEIRDLRTEFEESAKVGRQIRRQLPGLVLYLDQQRDREQVSALEQGTVDAQSETADIESILAEQIDAYQSRTTETDKDGGPHAGGGSESGTVSVEQTEPEALLENGESLPGL